jgi:phage-related minor tail protein
MTEARLSRRDSIRNMVALGVATGVATLGATAFMTEAADAAQPHMTTALNELQKALSELQSAIPDKKGHRVEAIRLVKEAITEVTKGLAAGAM